VCLSSTRSSSSEDVDSRAVSFESLSGSVSSVCVSRGVSCPSVSCGEVECSGVMEWSGGMGSENEVTSLLDLVERLDPGPSSRKKKKPGKFTFTGKFFCPRLI
jgi:hypothetical protein